MTAQKTTSLAVKPSLPDALELWRPALAAFKENWGVIAGLALTPLVVSVPLFLLLVLSVNQIATIPAHSTNAQQAVLGGAGLAMLLVYILLIILVALVGLALAIATLKSARGEKIEYMEALRESLPFFWRYVGLGIVTSLAVGVGLLLLIVPGIIMLRRYFLAPFYLVERDIGVFEAMDLSADASKKNKGIYGILVAFALMSLLAVVPFFGWMAAAILGLLYSCAPALRYLQYEKIAADEAHELAKAADPGPGASPISKAGHTKPPHSAKRKKSHNVT